MLSAVRLRPMEIGSMACGADPAVLLAALDDVAADPAVPRVELAGAGVVGMAVVAAVVMLVDGALEDVGGAFECGELGAAVLQEDPKLSKNASCG